MASVYIGFHVHKNILVGCNFQALVYCVYFRTYVILHVILHVHVRTSFFHCSYSLYEPKDIVLSEYKSGLEKAILKNSTLLVQLTL